MEHQVQKRLEDNSTYIQDKILKDKVVVSDVPPALSGPDLIIEIYQKPEKTKRIKQSWIEADGKKTGWFEVEA